MINVFEMYDHLVANTYRDKKISRTHFDYLSSVKTEDYDILLELVYELIHALKYAEYYITQERIEKGETMLATEQDDKKKSEYRKLLNDLTIKLEQLSPKGESA